MSSELQGLPRGGFLVACLVALLAMVVLDGIWLGLVAADFYRRELATLMADSVRLLPAALFYLLYPIGLVFVARPQVRRSSVQAALHGAAVGALAYGTYDLTNLATLRDWPALLSVVDMIWGTCASALACAAAQRGVVLLGRR